MSEQPPVWAQQLMASVQQMQQQQLELQQRFETLLITSATPPVPSELSSEALVVLSSHPFFADADRLYLQLLQQALPAAMTDDALDLLRRCFAELRSRVLEAEQSTGTPRSEPGTAAPVPPSGDPQVYVSRSGRSFDTRFPPPYPCRRCRTMHWSNTPCTSARSGYFQNSRTGTARPAPVPSPPAGRSARSQSTSR